MRVMTGRSKRDHKERQETISDVGAGSSGQDFFADCRTSFRTSSSLRGWKAYSAFSGPTSGSSVRQVCTSVDGLVNIRADRF